METMEILNNYSADQLSNWLDGQLDMIYRGTSEEKYRACDFRSFGIPRGESHIEDLQNLFKKLNHNAKEEFKKALSLSFRHAKPGQFPEKAMTDVLTLIGLTDAYKVFSSFSSVLGNGPWGEVKPSLIYDALSVLMMFERSDEAYVSAKELATSTYFPNSLVFDAYIVMIRSRPERWRDDYVLLRERFRKVIFEIESSSNLEQSNQLSRKQHSLAQSISKAVPMHSIGRVLATLDFRPSASLQKCSDVWLIDNLLGQSGSLIATTLEISDRAEPERKDNLITESDFEVIGFNRGWFNNQTDQYLDTGKKNLSPTSSGLLRNIMSKNNEYKLNQHCTRELANAW